MPHLPASILVIAQDDLIRDVIGDMLGRDGYNVTKSRSSSEGLDLARHFHFDLFVLEASLLEASELETSGRKFCSEVRDLHSDTPILFFFAARHFGQTDMSSGRLQTCVVDSNDLVELQETIGRLLLKPEPGRAPKDSRTWPSLMPIPISFNRGRSSFKLLRSKLG